MWNAWRRDPANEDVRVTFAGIDFSGWPRDGINFQGFEFGWSANFSNCTWRGGDPSIMVGRACFDGAAFGDSADFTGATFGRGANFTGATFGHSAKFTRASFGDWTTFAGAIFDDFADFSKAIFEGSVRFVRTMFGDDPKFTGRMFPGVAEFTGATFGWGGDFEGAAFEGLAFEEFTGVAFGDLAVFTQARFNGKAQFGGMSDEQWTKHRAGLGGMDMEAMVALEKRHKELWETNGSGLDRFLRISFANARFYDEAIFSGRSFEQRADFTDARFYSPPDFDGASNVPRIDFTGAYIGFARPGHFHWTSKSSFFSSASPCAIISRSSEAAAILQPAAVPHTRWTLSAARTSAKVTMSVIG